MEEPDGSWTIDTGHDQPIYGETPTKEAGTPTGQYRVARALVLDSDRITILIWPNGQVQLPGGKLEPGETPEQAAIRETKEEAGIDIEVKSWLCGMSDQYATRDYFLAALAPKLQEAEHIDPDGSILVNVEQVVLSDALGLLTSPYDKAAVGTYMESLKGAQG